MKLYTTQMSKWREVEKLGIPFKDVTVKSGDKQFAPTWDFLMEYKNNQDESKYLERFIPLMRKNYSENKQYWLDFLSQDEVCIACYCKSGKFCHRHILVNIFEKICQQQGIPFERMGEI
jgi:uncharacterized protein YeaO (DUF488 family)